MAKAVNVLTQLTSISVRDLHRRQADGTRIIDSIYASAASAGLVPLITPSLGLKDRYFLVFDLALNHLSCWVLDYCEEVCGDPHLTSADAEEAALLDGQFVREWCQRTLSRSEAAVGEALKSEAAFEEFAKRSLQQELAKVNTIVSVLQCLERIRSSGSGADALVLVDASAMDTSANAHDSAGVAAELRQALLLQQCYQAMEWCVRHGLHRRGGASGRYASVPDWVRRVQARRDRRRGQALFLDDLLQSLGMGGAYPFASLQSALHMIFLAVKDTSPATWHAKLALLLYYTADLGLLPDAAAAAAAGAGVMAGSAAAGRPACPSPLLEDFRSTFNLPAATATTWLCQLLLDCAEAQPATAAGAGAAATAKDGGLDAACALLVPCAQPSTPFKFVEVLLSLGRPEAALALHRACSGGAVRGLSLQQAATLVDLLLRCGLLFEAFLAVREHAAEAEAAAPAAGGAAAPVHDARGLLLRVGEWAASHHGEERPWLETFMALPFSPQEEEVVVGWLCRALEAGSPLGDNLPLFFAHRGRAPETLGAFNRWQARQRELQALGQPPSKHTQQVDALVDATCKRLTLPQRNVVVAWGQQQQLQQLHGSASSAAAATAAGVLQGLQLQLDADAPVMYAAVTGSGEEVMPPPLLTTRIPPLPPRPQQQPAAAAAAEQQGAAAAAPSGGLLQQQPAEQQPVLLEGAAGAAADGAASLFSLGPFAAPSAAHRQQPQGSGAAAGPSHAATNLFSMAPGTGGSRSLFSLSHGGVQQQQSADAFGALGAAGIPGVQQLWASHLDPRALKRPRTNRWL